MIRYRRSVVLQKVDGSYHDPPVEFSDQLDFDRISLGNRSSVISRGRSTVMLEIFDAFSRCLDHVVRFSDFRRCCVGLHDGKRGRSNRIDCDSIETNNRLSGSSKCSEDWKMLKVAKCEVFIPRETHTVWGQTGGD